MNNQIIMVLMAILAGVCAGYSGVVQMRRPHPGWLIAACLAVWLTLVYAGVVSL